MQDLCCPIKFFFKFMKFFLVAVENFSQPTTLPYTKIYVRIIAENFIWQQRFWNDAFLLNYLRSCWAKNTHDASHWPYLRVGTNPWYTQLSETYWSKVHSYGPYMSRRVKTKQQIPGIDLLWQVKQKLVNGRKTHDFLCQIFLFSITLLSSSKRKG